MQLAWVMGSVGRTQVIPPSLRYFLITKQVIHNPAQGGRAQDRHSTNEIAELWLSAWDGPGGSLAVAWGQAAGGAELASSVT